MCNPVSGECTDCTMNTQGRLCENCLEGYDRVRPISFLQCDECAADYFDVGNGTCTCKFVMLSLFYIQYLLRFCNTCV